MLSSRSELPFASEGFKTKARNARRARHRRDAALPSRSGRRRSSVRGFCWTPRRHGKTSLASGEFPALTGHALGTPWLDARVVCGLTLGHAGTANAPACNMALANAPTASGRQDHSPTGSQAISNRRSGFPEVQGHVSHGFEVVRQAFVENFARSRSRGGWLERASPILPGGPSANSQGGPRFDGCPALCDGVALWVGVDVRKADDPELEPCDFATGFWRPTAYCVRRRSPPSSTPADVSGAEAECGFVIG